MARLTLKAVNKALADAGHKERLAKGKDYWYFYDGDAPMWFESSVSVYRLNQLTIDQWLHERDRLAGK